MLKINKLPGLDAIVIRKEFDKSFLTSSNSIIISIPILISIINFLIKNGLISKDDLDI